MTVALTREFEPEPFSPRVESDVFDQYTSAQFWVGRVASGATVEMPSEYRALHVLRANVYIDEEGFLPETARTVDGGEYDDDDHRSEHFAIIENRTDHSKVVGGVRLIEKRDNSDLLPAETIFPEAFEGCPAEVNSVEVSRLIARHHIPLAQTLISLAAIRAADLYCVDKKVPNTYAVMERRLYVYLRMMGVPCHKMSSSKNTPEYGNTENMVVRINPRELLANATRVDNTQEILRDLYDINLDTNGLGACDGYFVPLEG